MLRFIIWLAASAIAIITTRHLYAAGFHYVDISLLLQLFPALGLQYIQRCVWSANGDKTDPTHPQTWLTCAGFGASAAASVFVILHVPKAILEFNNTTILVIFFTSAWIWGLTVMSWQLNSKLAVMIMLQLVTIGSCATASLIDENLLSNTIPEILTISMLILLIAVLSSSSQIALDRTTVIGLNSHSWALIVSIPLSMWRLHDWDMEMPDVFIGGHWLLLVISATAGAIALSQSPWCIYCGPDIEELCDRLELTQKSVKQIAGLLCVFAISLDNSFAQVRPSTTSLAQWSAYAIAMMTILDDQQIQHYSQWIQQQPWPLLFGRQNQQSREPLAVTERLSLIRSKDNTPTHIARCLLLCLGVLLLGITLLFHMPAAHIALATNPHYDYDLDIVIARYSRPLVETISVAEAFLNGTVAPGYRSRIIIYNKGEADQGQFEDFLTTSPWSGSVIIKDRPNVGREGETFLYHTIAENADLAHHTLFIQEEPHELDAAVVRFRDYFVSDTGFLTLWQPQDFVPICQSSFAMRYWTENTTLLQDIFAHANPGLPCQDISLTYKGQFVVSRTAAQKVDRALLENLHAKAVEDPKFGFTLERLWGVIFGCPQISPYCPSLESGMWNKKASVGACQCMEVSYS